MIAVLLPAYAQGANPALPLPIAGEGTVTVPADTAIISVSVQSGNENRTAASADAQEKMDRVIDAVKRAGVKDEEIMPGQSSGVTSFQSTSKVCRRVNNSTVCENDTLQASSLEISAVIRLNSTDESRINSLLNAAESAGAKAYLAGYGLSDSSKATAQARQKAVANARENAAAMAAAEGLRLGKVMDISDYGYPAGLADYYGSSSQAGMVDVTSYVIVTYEIEI
ncbi:MAG: SIMPL domain-containing protein [Methanothrix sp.]|nr:SIMPL domain-containing protein [Methanothrix sp.]